MVMGVMAKEKGGNGLECFCKNATFLFPGLE